MNRMIAFLLFVALAAPVSAEMVVRDVSYAQGDTEFRSVLIFEEGAAGPLPGLVMVPNWMGMTDANVEKAKDIAARGYVVLVADIYGADVRPADAQEAAQAAGDMRADREVLRERANLALNELKALGQSDETPVDPARLGAIGFCFGGSTVLEMARAGMDLAGVVSFHGGLATDVPAETTPEASVLVLNGADDASVTDEQIAEFETEMSEVDADWQLVQFGGAVHCFAEADADSPPNCLYHEPSARRAFAMMDMFLTERFGDSD